MPIFEYRCLDCEKEFETLVLSQDDEITCVTCSGNNLEKLFSAFGVKSEGEVLSTESAGAVSCCASVGCGCGVK